ncbi:MAG: hypothetical protein ACRBB3_06935 [Alphaproteobacteria bacterium]
MEQSTFISSVLPDIGLPLVRTIIENCKAEDEESITQEMEKLLALTVKSNDYIKDALEINDSNSENPDLHLLLSSLSSKIIASHYERTKASPTDKDLKQITGAINALLIFSENYAPIINLTDAYPENKDKPSLSPKHTTDLIYISVFLPLINAVSTFSFGLNPSRMIQNVSEKMGVRTTQIRSHLLGDTLNDKDRKTAEIRILKTLIDLYSSCYMQEISRITEIGQSENQPQSNKQQIEHIWNLFENRVSLLFGLAQEASSETSNYTTENAEEDVAALFEESQTKNVEEDVLPNDDQPTTPMSFYKKK